MKDVILKSVTVTDKNGQGYFLYNAASKSSNKNIFGLPDLTLPKAQEVIGNKVWLDSKYTISVYYF